MTWSTTRLKDSHLFKITKIIFFLKQKMITVSAILNKWESFSRIVDKWRGPPEDYIISPILGSNLRDVQSEISNSSRQWFLPIGKDTKASYPLIVNFSTWGCNSFNNTFVQPEAHPFNSAFCNIPTVIHIARSCLMLRACLDIVYFTETEKLLLKIKISWNSTVRPMNSTKMCNETYK